MPELAAEVLHQECCVPDVVVREFEVDGVDPPVARVVDQGDVFGAIGLGEFVVIGVGDQEVGVLAAREDVAGQGWDDVMDGVLVLASNGALSAAVEEFGGLLVRQEVLVGVGVDFDGEGVGSFEGFVVLADFGGGRDGRVGCRSVDVSAFVH